MEELRMVQMLAFFDIRDALSLPGCPVCRLKAEYIERFLDNLLYEKVNDPGLRSRIRRARGFCNEHAWELMRRGASLGVSIIMQDVVNTVLQTVANPRLRSFSPLSLRRVLRALDPRKPQLARSELIAQLTPKEPCLICTYAGEVEEASLNALCDNLFGQTGLLAMYASSDGLCLPHFRQALTCIDNETMLDALADAQEAIWNRLHMSLSEFIRKSDYRFRSETPGDENGAWLRAIAAVSGEHRCRNNL